MMTKKILPALLTASFIFTSVHAAAGPQITAYAKSAVTFHTGAAYNETMGIQTQKINSLKIPKGCTGTIYSPDVGSTEDALTSANTKIAGISTLHQGMGWVVHAKNTGKTTLRYKKGSHTGKLDVEVLPALKLTALKKSAKVSGDKLYLTVKYKNGTDTAITIEGVDIGRSQILFEGEKEPSKESSEAIIPSRWIAKKVTIPAGKTKSVTVTEPVSKKGTIKKFDYPSVYLKYHNVYFSTTPDRSRAVSGVACHDTTSFAAYHK